VADQGIVSTVTTTLFNNMSALTLGAAHAFSRAKADPGQGLAFLLYGMLGGLLNVCLRML
jgi:hypothetical protein